MKRSAQLAILSFLLTMCGSSSIVPSENPSNTSLDGPSGGGGGNSFHDYLGLRCDAVVQIRLCGDTYVDSLTTTWLVGGKPLAGERHGGTGGVCKTLDLQPNEFLTDVQGTSGLYIDSLMITTNTGRVLKVGGTGGGVGFHYTADPDEKIIGFFGKSGNYLDAIGVEKLQLRACQPCEP